MLLTQNPTKVKVSPEVSIRGYGTFLATRFPANWDISSSRLFVILGRLDGESSPQCIDIRKFDLLSYFSYVHTPVDHCGHTGLAQLVILAHFSAKLRFFFIRMSQEISIRTLWCKSGSTA